MARVNIGTHASGVQFSDTKCTPEACVPAQSSKSNVPESILSLKSLRGSEFRVYAAFFSAPPEGGTPNIQSAVCIKSAHLQRLEKISVAKESGSE
jgi:hypothetical protein